MNIRNAISLAVCAVALGRPLSASAQGAPFTIRFPPDGASVREKVRVEIPRASLEAGSTLAFFIDDKFVVALPAQPDSANGPFTYIWDTKGNDLPGQEVPDGPHTIKAVLYTPTPGGTEAMSPKGSSEIKVTVANAIKGVGPVSLRYKLPEGQNMEYSRDGRSVIVGALSGLRDVGDKDLATVKSRLVLDIEDASAQESLVRNKLTALTIEENGSRRPIDPHDLSASIYQELTPLGKITYATGEASGESGELNGLAINNTLSLPLLPAGKVAPGDAWTDAAPQPIDIPGMPRSLQPPVTLSNKFEGFEWESGYPTAKIRQTFEGTVSRPILFGGILVTSPKISFNRVIYLAYNSGTLVKIVRTMTVAGQTTAVLEAAAAQGAGAPRPGGLGGGAPATGRPPGGFGGGAPAAGRPPGGLGAAGAMRRGLGGGTPQGGFGGGAGGGGVRPGGFGGMGAPGLGAGSGRFGGLAGAGAGAAAGTPPPGGLGNRGNGGLPSQTAAPHPVTLKSTTITQLVRITR